MVITLVTPGSRPARSEERPRKRPCVHDELLTDGSIVLYNTCNSALVTLNPTGAIVWECCDGSHDLDMIAAEVREIFPTAATIERDVLALLQQMLGQGFIVDESL